MSILKKLSVRSYKALPLLLLALLYLPPAWAGSMGSDCNNADITVPCERMAWNLGGQVLYVQPSFSGVQNVPLIDTEGSVRVIKGESLKYALGFKLEGSHHFSTGNDLNLNGYYMSPEKTRVRVFSEEVTSTGLTYQLPTLLSLKPTWSAVNLEWGQRVDFGMNSYTRFHAGVQYTNMKTIFRKGAERGVVSFNNNGIPVIQTPYHFVTVQSMRYQGFGPRFGGDITYHVKQGFSLTADAGLGLIVGISKFNIFHRNSSIPGNLFFSPSRTTIGSKAAMVPELEGKMSARYQHAIPLGDISLDAGWMWINYFNVFMWTPQSELSFAMQGPYLGLKWVGSLV